MAESAELFCEARELFDRIFKKGAVVGFLMDFRAFREQRVIDGQKPLGCQPMRGIARLRERAGKIEIQPLHRVRLQIPRQIFGGAV